MGSKIEKVVTEESEEQYGTTAGQADAANAYMAHCHLLEHEDTGMMLGFTVA